MFFLSIALGALFLVMVHHLTDAGWSVATRRVCEHLASLLFPWLAILFVPVVLFAQTDLFLDDDRRPACQHCVERKMAGVHPCRDFCVVSAVFFGIWWLLSSRLRYWSLSRMKPATRYARTGCGSIRGGGLSSSR